MRVINSENFRLVLFDSGKLGPTVCIVGGVHGDEICGPIAIDRLERKLATENYLLRGRLMTLIANSEAIRLKKRFVDFDLNRAFKNSAAFGHEAQLAKCLTPYLKEVDYLLDLHSTSAATRPFCAGAFTEPHLKIFRITGFEFYTYGWGEHRKYTLLVDEVDRLGGVGVIAECGKTGDYQTNEISFSTITHLLQELEMIKPVKLRTLQNPTLIEINQIVKAKTDYFIFKRDFESFETIEAGEIVAYDDKNPVVYPFRFTLVMPTRGKIRAGDDAFVVGIFDREL
ncbi:MAG: succinylglutamate desuccinylase/aspartoacylase family protein [Xenococcaceae cyanobacterium MO_188.B29]|nr:succinylglutamate desuccinylase/aspartoacylase family protein [Xenococcaceae cyanobacterium MO_188.B29]